MEEGVGGERKKQKSDMGAISLYRGNLHRVPDVPRRWLMPSHQICLKDFRNLLRRRSRALKLYPNPQSDTNLVHETHRDCVNVKDQGGFDGKSLDNEPVAVHCLKPVMVDSRVDSIGGRWDSKSDNPGGSGNPNPEIEEARNLLNGLNGDGKRKSEIEEKLQGLKQIKHNLVQVLKQIINAEEELKRRSIQSPVITDDNSNHNIVSRNLHRAPYPSRASLGVTTISCPTYMASSPSPAASGGTSVFRDTRLPSPWS